MLDIFHCFKVYSGAIMRILTLWYIVYNNILLQVTPFLKLYHISKCNISSSTDRVQLLSFSIIKLHFITKNMTHRQLFQPLLVFPFLGLIFLGDKPSLPLHLLLGILDLSTFLEFFGHCLTLSLNNLCGQIAPVTHN